MKVLLTGATGFLGGALLKYLVKADQYALVAAVRSLSSPLNVMCESIIVGDISAKTNWEQAVFNVDVVIHTAARVHIMSESAVDSLTAFCEVNARGTLNLAQQATEAGVKRFIFISSIKVNGEGTCLPTDAGCEGVACFTAEDTFIPVDPYGASKYNAEQGLLALAQKTGMEIVIIRPPLIYGPAVKANFALMMKWVGRGVPLPFGAINNKRSLLALDNLVSFIAHCIHHPKAVNEVFLISDGEDVSTTELLNKVARALGKKSLLLPIPVSWLKFAASLMGKDEAANRLLGSLQVDSSKAHELLDWKPVISMDEQLKKMVGVVSK